MHLNCRSMSIGLFLALNVTRISVWARLPIEMSKVGVDGVYEGWVTTSQGDCDTILMSHGSEVPLTKLARLRNDRAFISIDQL